MTEETIKTKLAQIEQELKNTEANYNRLAGAKLMLEQLLAEMNAPKPVADTAPTA